MRAIPIEHLNDRLIEYLSFAESGETILVTDGDRVVAELGPPSTEHVERASDDAVVAEGVRAGWITSRRYIPDVAAARRPVADVLADLDHDREER